MTILIVFDAKCDIQKLLIIENMTDDITVEFDKKGKIRLLASDYFEHSATLLMITCSEEEIHFILLCQKCTETNELDTLVGILSEVLNKQSEVLNKYRLLALGYQNALLNEKTAQNNKEQILKCNIKNLTNTLENLNTELESLTIAEQKQLQMIQNLEK
ncbi:hypothetical protein RFI_13621 [Reticulomyxa filosa]|uniref:Uncharacterized protein n=1 Tax=Reticulomyxa filosa TaxID=46433 RepID=X6NDY4_RETFI|nr:hypothetical protein RFI_13621 [Reticulomyxa filosa]|eukprot:ETO23557.1 hypothetical protein RFI_13621 [Reticulomyxa filosa]